jgi:starch-binding outer membrane protein, SusD/RagB family
MKSRNHPRRARNVRLGLMALPLALIVACGDVDIFEQSNPGEIDAGDVYRPANAQLLVNGMLSDFECAYSRTVTGSGILADEIGAAIAQALNFNWDRRTLLPNHPYDGGCGGAQYPGVYTSLSRARGSADTTYARIADWTVQQVPDRERFLGQLSAYGGWTLSLMGEVMCTSAIDMGPELSSEQVFQEALSRFNTALTHAQAAGDVVTGHLARLGRARIHLNLGNLDLAEEDAALIPADFLVATTPAAVDLRLQNIVHAHINQNNFGTVGETFRGLTLNGDPDPRVMVTDEGRVGSAGSPIFTADKYPALTTPIPVATYAEAQLIVAEARIAADDLDGAADAINAARNSGGRVGMPQFDATGLTQAEVMAQLVEERRRELFLEGRRLWDVRRMNLPLVPAPGEPYVVGGGTYGDQRCFPLPDVERNNNPNIP